VAVTGLRRTAGAAVLTGALLAGGWGAGIAAADTGDGDGPSSSDTSGDTASSTGSDSNNAGAQSVSAHSEDAPVSRVGSGRPETLPRVTSESVQGVAPEPARVDGDASGADCGPAHALWSLIELPITVTRKVLEDLGPQPAPQQQTVGPALRTAEIETPVIDAATGNTGGGGGLPATGPAEPQPLSAPLIVAPRLVPLRPPAPVQASAPAAAPATIPTQVIGAQATSGLSVPGASAPAAAPSSSTALSAAPLDAKLTRFGMPAGTPAAAVAQLLLVALPGLIGLFGCIFGGGLMGYRQANAARYIRVSGRRFLRDTP
jgi:hypothetical protein